MFRHVLCVFPYPMEHRRDDFWPPLGLEVIAAALEPHAEAIDVVDLRRERAGTVDFLRPDTDMVCFSVNSSREHDFVRGEILSVPADVLTVAGGRYVTEDPERWLADCPNVDVIVRGDGEETVDDIARGLPLQDIAGISYRLDSAVVHNPVRRLGPVRDDLYPNRRLRRYVYRLLEGYGGTLTLDSVASSRGCPFNCRFCVFNRNPWGTRRDWSARAPESVVRELEEIEAEVVFFVDDNFTHDMDRVGAICDLILERGIRKRYIAEGRVEMAKRPDVLRKMERAGFGLLSLGIESAQDESLRSMKKGFDTKQLREYFRVLRRSRMIVDGTFIIGNIGETEAQMRAIAPFARELGLDTIRLHALRNERHSGLEELVAENPGYHIAPNGKIYSDRYSRARLRQIRHGVYRSFFTPGQMLRTLKKLLRNRLITPGMIARLPWFLVCKDLWSRRRRKAPSKRRRSAARAR